MVGVTPLIAGLLVFFVMAPQYEPDQIAGTALDGYPAVIPQAYWGMGARVVGAVLILLGLGTVAAAIVAQFRCHLQRHNRSTNRHQVTHLLDEAGAREQLIRSLEQVDGKVSIGTHTAPITNGWTFYVTIDGVVYRFMVMCTGEVNVASADWPMFKRLVKVKSIS